MGSRDGKAIYSTIDEARGTFNTLLKDLNIPIPDGVRECGEAVKIEGVDGNPTIPTPWRETEAISALKALEASVALALGKVRFGIEQTAQIDIDHATIFLFMSYLSSIDGYGKWDPRSIERLKPTDLHQAQSNLYRRLSANMYKTKDPQVYYHLHGSLEATPILNFVGLPGFDESLNEYDKICEVIQKQCQNFTAVELDKATEDLRQAGAIVFKQDDFLNTEQGQTIVNEPIFSMDQIEDESPPAAFPPLSKSSASDKPQILEGIKILDLSRVIAGPVITRTLAEYGAHVLKVTCGTLPDVPYYQVDLNFGKRTTDLDLRTPEDRKKFDTLLDDGVDVIVDGYRTGALDRLGYGPDDLSKRFASRGKGFVYVRENCFGFKGPWKERSGWQPVADAVSGLAWGQGEAMGLDEPVLPPFPLSDYGTGELGAIAALVGLYNRATKGGSYVTGVSLTQYNLWVMSLNPYPKDVWQDIWRNHSETEETRALGHLSNFDIVSKAALKSMKRLYPRLFDDKYMFEMEAPGFGGNVKSCRPVVKCTGTTNWWRETTRPNGWDEPTW